MTPDNRFPMDAVTLMHLTHPLEEGDEAIRSRSKPFTFEELAKRVRDVLDRS